MMKYGKSCYCDPTNIAARIQLLHEHDEQNELGVDTMGGIGSAMTSWKVDERIAYFDDLKKYTTLTQQEKWRNFFSSNSVLGKNVSAEAVA